MNWPPPTAYVPPPPPRPSGWSAMAIIATVAAGGLVLGSFLPWVTVRIFVGQLSVSGFDGGDGKLTAGAGVVAAAFFVGGASGHVRALLITGALVAALGAAVAVYDLVDISKALGGIDSEFADANAGVGLYLCALSGVVAFIGGMIAQSDAKYATA